MKSKENNSPKSTKKEQALLLKSAIQSIQFELLATYEIGEKVKIQYLKNKSGLSYYDNLTPNIIQGKIVGANISNRSKKISSYWVELTDSAHFDPYYIKGQDGSITCADHFQYYPQFWTPNLLQYKRNLNKKILVRMKVNTLNHTNKITIKKK